MSADASSIISPARWRMRLAASADVKLQKTVLSLYDQAVELHFPDSIETDVKFLFPVRATVSAPIQASIRIDEQEPGRFSILKGAQAVSSNLTRVELLVWLSEEITEALITRQNQTLVFHAAAVGWRGTSIVLPGPSGSGKSSLAAWLVNRGFDYLSDEIALLTKDDGIVGSPARRHCQARGGRGGAGPPIVPRGPAGQIWRASSLRADPSARPGSCSPMRHASLSALQGGRDFATRRNPPPPKPGFGS